jgi:hypothetical protein
MQSQDAIRLRSGHSRLKQDFPPGTPCPNCGATFMLARGRLRAVAPDQAAHAACLAADRCVIQVGGGPSDYYPRGWYEAIYAHRALRRQSRRSDAQARFPESLLQDWGIIAEWGEDTVDLVQNSRRGLVAADGSGLSVSPSWLLGMVRGDWPAILSGCIPPHDRYANMRGVLVPQDFRSGRGGIMLCVHSSNWDPEGSIPFTVEVSKINQDWKWNFTE